MAFSHFYCRTRGALGFSLIEVMIVVAVLAIVASIAFPSYRDYVKRGKRVAAQNVLVDLAARQQAFLLDKRRYGTTMAELGFTSDPAEIDADFDFAVAANNGVSPPIFTVTALATASGIMVGDLNMTVDQNGTKLPVAYWKK